MNKKLKTPTAHSDRQIRIPTKEDTVLNAATSYLAQFNLSAAIMDSMPTTVRLAVIDLQNNNILPPITIREESIDLKDEFNDFDDELRYNYYRLPADLHSVQEFDIQDRPPFEYIDAGEFFKGTKPTRGTSRKDQFVDDGVLRTVQDILRRRHLLDVYTVTRETYNDGRTVNRLIPNPFPEDDELITIVYHVDGINTPVEIVGEKYYMVVLTHVMHQLGLKSAHDLDKQISRAVRDRLSPNERSGMNRSVAKTTPTFFTNHRRRLRWGK